MYIFAPYIFTLIFVSTHEPDTESSLTSPLRYVDDSSMIEVEAKNETVAEEEDETIGDVFAIMAGEEEEAEEEEAEEEPEEEEEAGEEEEEEEEQSAIMGDVQEEEEDETIGDVFA